MTAREITNIANYAGRIIERLIGQMVAKNMEKTRDNMLLELQVIACDVSEKQGHELSKIQYRAFDQVNQMICDLFDGEV